MNGPAEQVSHNWTFPAAHCIVRVAHTLLPYDAPPNGSNMKVEAPVTCRERMI